MRVIGLLLVQCSVLATASVARAEWHTSTIGGTSVHLYTPASHGTIGTGRAVLVALHGCTQTNDQLHDRGNFEPAADAYGMVVALPQVPNGGVVAGCWDYYGADHARTGRHDQFLLELVAMLLADSTLAIDPSQVYIAGLSSGAGEAGIMGCLAPDVFAGVGINAGPAPGTSISQFSTVAVDAEEASRTCAMLAGSASDSFGTQMASVIAGTSDFVVAQGYARVDAEMFAAVYGPSLVESSFDVSMVDGYQPQGMGAVFSDGVGPRVSLIVAQGMGHAFPAGSGPGQEINFVASAGVNWSMYLAKFFSENNRRVSGGTPRPDAGVIVQGDGGGGGDGSMGRDGSIAQRDGGGTSDGEMASESSASGCGCVASARGDSASLIVLAVLLACCADLRRGRRR